MDELLHHLEQAKVRYQDGETYSPHIFTSINNAWSILNKYYTLPDLAPGMLGAVALPPEMKYEYFKDEWTYKPAWIGAAPVVSHETGGADQYFWLNYSALPAFVSIVG